MGNIRFSRIEKNRTVFSEKLIYHNNRLFIYKGKTLEY